MPRDESPDLGASLDYLVAALEQRGVPQGMWLVEIEQVRSALRSADDLLRRLHAAVVRDASGSQRLPDPGAA